MALLALTCLVIARAQENKPVGLRIRCAIPVAFNSCTIRGVSESWTGPVPGFQAGFMLMVDPGYENHWMGTAEILASSAGSKYEETYVSGSVRNLYAAVPLMVRYQANGGFFGEVGMQPAVLLSAKDKYGGSTYNYKESVNTFDFGVPVGIGYVFKKKVGINCRYTRGLTNVNKGDPDKDQNRIFSFRVFWILD